MKPINMTSNCGQTTPVAGPSMIGPEVGSTGSLAEQMYYVGTTIEQALMVNVKGKGLV